MRIHFSKYHGSGNDFIILNNMLGDYDLLSISQIQFLCNRHIGIGADGLIKISKKKGFDFEIEYFNSDGSQSFCGNGARCSVAYAESIGIVNNKAFFYAIDGPHKAFVKSDSVCLEMSSVEKYETNGDDFIINTGSPHYIHILDDIRNCDVVKYGRSVRFQECFDPEGINVNVMSIVSKNEINIATYERGVENETLSCGTGAVACALIFMIVKNKSETEIKINTKGGLIEVSAKKNNDSFHDIWLTGPVKFVFEALIDV